MNYLTEHYKNKSNALQYRKNLLILEINSLEQSLGNEVQATSGLEDFSNNGIDYTNYGLGVWLARVAAKGISFIDDGLTAAGRYLQRLFGNRSFDEIVEIVKTIPGYQIRVTSYDIINGVKIPHPPPSMKKAIKYIQGLFDADWPLTRMFNGQRLPDGVFYDRTTGQFWLQELPSTMFPSGRPMFYHPGSGTWQTYIGPAGGNPFGFDVIYVP